MNLIAIGVNHKTAPIEVRERISLPEPEAKKLLVELCESKIASEALILSTCNRTELYVVPGLPEVTADYLKDYLISRKDARKDINKDHFFSLFACGVIKHFLEVACAVDSMILGEVQIIGQVKTAYQMAIEVKSTGPILNKLCHTAFSVANKVRNNTKLTAGAVSISYAAVELTKKIYSDLSTKNILLVGAGDTAKLAAKNL
ncbi:MAG: glutamyl-tRNA reductase, partial [Chlorobiales bacterium]|nr:glutamyl-tRNA reductase [Chlorobiales bacterium]